MSDRKLKIFALAVGLQLVVLIGMVVSAHLPLLIGTEIRVKTYPVDPRSLFRGNYAKLKYDFSEINSDRFEPGFRTRKDEIVYVSLMPDSNNIYHVHDVSFDLPEEGVFLRGRMKYRGWNDRPREIKYGLEAYFAPKKEALKLERDLREGATAVLMVSGSGRARIKEIVPNNSK